MALQLHWRQTWLTLLPIIPSTVDHRIAETGENTRGAAAARRIRT
jgi:hypothetical protein